MSFADRDGVIWMDGKLVDWRDANTHVLTHTLHYGMGVFEGVRAYNAGKYGTCIFRLQAHTDRLFRSAHIMGMHMPYKKDELIAAQKLVVRENGLSEGYIRPMAYLGSEGMGLRADGLQTHIIIAAWEWPIYMTKEAIEQSAHLELHPPSRQYFHVQSQSQWPLYKFHARFA